MLENLFAPILIGSVECRNRIVSTSHGTRMAVDNCISERDVGYYGEKARGGAGLIFIEGVRPHESSLPGSSALLGTAPGMRDGFSAIARAVHEQGGLVFGQVMHQGRIMGSAFHRRPIMAPSAVPVAVTRETPHAMTRREITTMVKAYAQTAAIMRQGGLDGVELHGAHGYLVGQFLSPRSNRRTDEYGGSLDNRMRFGLEALAAMREAVGPGFPLGLRLNGADFVEGGLGPADYPDIARRFVEAAGLDWISVSLGGYEGEGLSAFLADHGYEPGGFSGLAGAIRKQVKVPVIAVGRINSPELAESILARGDADLVAMTRALMADPFLPRKAEEGRIQDIRPCIACNLCLVMNLAGQVITCAVNPAVGLERSRPNDRFEPASRPQRVVIVGGGVAGMEAARVAAARGHQVVLFERGEALGGQLLTLAKAKSRPEIADLLAWQIGQIKGSQIDIRLRTEATPELIRAQAPDVVLIASGAHHVLPQLPPLDRPAMTVFEVLNNPPASRLGKALILDYDHHLQAVTAAHHLVERGWEVVIASANPMIGADAAINQLPGLLKRLKLAGVEILTLVELERVQDGEAVLAHRLESAPRRVKDVDLVVVAGGRLAEDRLWRDMEENGDIAGVLGDAAAPRMIWQAMRDGYIAAYDL
jgi:2,4-dienoyl-CoA reductase-like NADH-dependent reductase (Old Yellow Enzyme family)